MSVYSAGQNCGPRDSDESHFNYFDLPYSERSDRSPLRGGDLGEGQTCKRGQRPRVDDHRI